MHTHSPLTASPAIPGLHYHPSYVSSEAQLLLLDAIDQQPWSTELRRRVQHYGYRYDYTSHQVTAQMQAAPFPAWLSALATQLHADGRCPLLPDQVIINEYVPGQGIAAHIDCVPCFGNTILSLSLGSGCNMQFAQSTTQAQAVLWLEPGSLLVMTGDARYQWKHGIPARKTDTLAGQRIPRQRRVSLTFRTVILSPYTAP